MPGRIEVKINLLVSDDHEIVGLETIGCGQTEGECFSAVFLPSLRLGKAEAKVDVKHHRATFSHPREGAVTANVGREWVDKLHGFVRRRRLLRRAVALSSGGFSKNSILAPKACDVNSLARIALEVL